MDKTFHVFDLHRMFIGDTPVVFLLEIVVRTFIMYGYTVLLLRFLGKRGMGQLSMLELAIIIAFGSAVGDPMVGADVPILHGMVAITAVTFFQIGLEKLINKNAKIESLMEGSANLIVEDGIIQMDCLKKDNLSKEDLFRALRSKDVDQLGQIKKAFFETNGQVSVMFQPPKNVKPGLTVVPENDIEPDRIFKAGTKAPAKDLYSCFHCGNTTSLSANESFKNCDNCNCDGWIKAIV